MRATLRAYRQKLWVLRQFEGRRYLRWPAAAVGLLGAVWALPFAGAVGSAYIARAGSGFVTIALSATITLSLGGAGAAWSRRRPWWNAIATRADAYLEPGDPRDCACALISLGDYHRATRALWRAGLNERSRSSPPPPDLPEFDTVMYVSRPGICVRADQPNVSDATREVLAVNGIRGRVDGIGICGVPSVTSVAVAGSTLT